MVMIAHTNDEGFKRLMEFLGMRDRLENVSRVEIDATAGEPVKLLIHALVDKGNQGTFSGSLVRHKAKEVVVTTYVLVETETAVLHGLI